MGWLWAFMGLVCVSCASDDFSSVSTDEGYNVRLLIDPQATSTRAGLDDVSVLKQLRVYVFNTAGERVGYHEDMDLTTTGQAYYIPFRLSEGGELTFYVVANEGGASVSNNGYYLTENTSLDKLEIAGFLTENIDRDPGDLMTGTVSHSIVAQGDNVDVVPITLVRPFSLLNVYFAKTSASCEATVESVKLYQYTRYGLFTDRDVSSSSTTERGNVETSAEWITSSSWEVTQVVPEDEQFTGNYGTEDQCFSKPVTLHTEGSSQWDNQWVSTEVSGASYLLITYTLNGEQRKDVRVYLPPISQTNCKYNVKCLIKESGGLAIACQVQPWADVKHDYELSANGQFKLEAINVKPVGDGERIYATQYVEGAGAADRQFTVALQMVTPEGVRWQAHLTDALNFEFVGENEGVGGTTEPVTLRVRPTKSYDGTLTQPRETELYVTIGTAPNNKQTFYARDTQPYGDGTSIRIRQVSTQDGDALWGSGSGEEQP